MNLQADEPFDVRALNPQVIEETNSNKTNKQNQLKKYHLMNSLGLHDTSQYGKMKLFQNILSDRDSLSIAQTETHLNGSVVAAELHIENYTYFFNDHKNRECGGVAFYLQDGHRSSVSLLKLKNLKPNNY